MLRAEQKVDTEKKLMRRRYDGSSQPIVRPGNDVYCPLERDAV